MPLEITVGPPQLVIHDGETVWATEPDGQLSLESSKGLMFFDTRMLSTWSIYANGESWLLLNAGAFTHYAARIYLTNPPITTENGVIAEHSLSLVIGRWIEGGDPRGSRPVTNHGLKSRCKFQPRDRDAVRLRRRLRGEVRPVLFVVAASPPNGTSPAQILRTALRANARFRQRHRCHVRVKSATHALYRQWPASALTIELERRAQSWHGVPAVRSRRMADAATTFISHLQNMPRMTRRTRALDMTSRRGARTSLKLASHRTRNSIGCSTRRSTTSWRCGCRSRDEGGDGDRDPRRRAAVVRGAVRTRQPDSVDCRRRLLSIEFARGSLSRPWGCCQSRDTRRLPRRGAGQDPARDAPRRARAFQADPAHAVFRHGRRDAAVAYGAALGVALDRRPAR